MNDFRTEILPQSSRVRELGRGRSGIVIRCHDLDGHDVARKIFLGDFASKTIHYLISGAPSAYVWNRDAVCCALVRRQILVNLVEYWFRSKLYVATAYAGGWNERTNSFYMDTEFVAGRPAALHHPFSGNREGESRRLATEVMGLLQARLAEAGIDGLVWQAGRGNPVAANNFLRLKADGNAWEWAWIDLESGVPALFPINPLALVSFYLPKSWHHGRVLFDDVDVDKLRRYVDEHSEGLEAVIGPDRWTAMAKQIDLLEVHQDAWRSLGRVQRGICYRLSQHQITAEQADWYRDRPLRWHASELRLALAKAWAQLLRLLPRVMKGLVQFDYLGALQVAWRYMTSQRYRSLLARAYVAARIDRWRRRDQLSAEEAQFLSEVLHREAVSSYITDFGVHIALKPPIKFLQWGVVPVLFASGVIGVGTTAALIAFGGMIGRTLYTLGRTVQAALTHERPPWIALGVGLLPVVGNVAYPVQIVYLGAERAGKLAGFIIYDTLTAAGELLPVWGGRDTATEHWFNRLADLIVRDRRLLSDVRDASVAKLTRSTVRRDTALQELARRCEMGEDAGPGVDPAGPHSAI